tara:strand:- start:671 stop:1567 length:897 start_codon:yes stop_codon:yes gene_type:complete
MTKTVFYGNGINYLSEGSISWNDLLEELMRDTKFETQFVPNIIAYERIRLNWKENENLKGEIVEKLKGQTTNKYFQKLLHLDVTDFISTNYDYAILEAHKLNDPQNSLLHRSTENLYSLRRHKQLICSKANKSFRVWNIHGELDVPKSIMLGMNHYCGSIGKINQYLKGEYDFGHKEEHKPIASIEQKLENKSFDHYSWVELFFSGDVHMAGFGLDFSEIDLWWVLTKRARLMATSKLNNKVYYYVKPINQVTREKELEKRRRETLESLNVVVVEIELIERNYGDQWTEIIKRIETSR